MSFRLRALVLLYWVVPFGALAATWNAIPGNLTHVGLLIAASLIGISALARQPHYPLIGTVFFLLLLANYWLSFLLTSQIAVTVFVFTTVTLIGLLTRRLNRLPVSQEVVIHWVVLGFLVAQINSLLTFWPFTFLENTLVSFISFYTFWQLIQLLQDGKRSSLIAHFVFTILTAILVIGAVLWVNYPHLRI